MEKTPKNKIAYNSATKLFNILLSIYYNGYNNTANKKKEKMGEKYNPNNLLIVILKFVYSKKKDEEKSK